MFKALLMPSATAGLLVAVALTARHCQGRAVQDSHWPVLVELFTSEGCSSCPPADLLLMELDRAEQGHGTEVIVLSEHVDYWNRLGWKDPFASAQFTDRQRTYAARFGETSVYTPEMVVDGRAGFVGSDRRHALRAIADAAKQPKAKVTLALGSYSRAFGNRVRFSIPCRGTPKSGNRRAGRRLSGGHRERPSFPGPARGERGTET